jgi:hypothetical protein
MVVFGPGWNSGPEMAEPQTIPVRREVINVVKIHYLILTAIKLRNN